MPEGSIKEFNHFDSLFIDRVFKEEKIDEDNPVWKYLQMKEVDLIWDIAIKTLSERQLQCFYLRFYYTLSEGDIGKLVNISQPLVHLNIQDALHKLQHHLGGAPMKSIRQIKKKISDIDSWDVGCRDTHSGELKSERQLGALYSLYWVLGLINKDLDKVDENDIAKIVNEEEKK